MDLRYNYYDEYDGYYIGIWLSFLQEGVGPKAVECRQPWLHYATSGEPLKRTSRFPLAFRRWLAQSLSQGDIVLTKKNRPNGMSFDAGEVGFGQGGDEVA